MILTKRYWIDRVQKLEITIPKMKSKGLKYNIENSFFGHTKMEYLGFWVTHNGIKPINKTIEAITNMKAHTSGK